MNYINGTIIAPTYPFVERVIFSTEIISFGSLKKADVGSPTRYDTQSNIPNPSYIIKEDVSKETIVSEENLREQRRGKFESALRKYSIHYDSVGSSARTAVKNFFISRKGRYNNFTIQETEISPYTQYSFFGGSLTTVNFDSDTLTIEMVKPGLFDISVPIIESYNSIRIPKNLYSTHEFVLTYSTDDLSSLISFFETNALGRDVIFNFNPYSMVSTYLENQTYTVRFDNDTFERSIVQVGQDTVQVILKEVVT